MPFRIRVAILAALLGAARPAAAQTQWQKTFDVPAADFRSTGRNTYFILEPGFRLTLKHGGDSLRITVLDETKTVAGVTTRVVEEREWADGELEEVSRNYFAINSRTNDVYYFGEDVDMYSKGRITSHEGSWLAGVNGAKYGLMMPAAPRVGARYYQELAPGKAMDRAEVVRLGEVVVVRAGRLEHVLRTRESSDLERGTEDKLYAPGIGLIREGDLKLTSYGPATPGARKP